jgi:predicted component of type VI protein secretion system
LIAHYRHNNEWKQQSQLELMDESFRDLNGNEPKDSFMFYMGLFHKVRRNEFNEFYGGNRNHLSPNLNFTTNSEQQIDLAKRILENVAITNV